MQSQDVEGSYEIGEAGLLDEIPFTEGDRKLLREIHAMMAGVAVFLENFDPSTLIQGLLTQNPILGSFIKQ